MDDPARLFPGFEAHWLETSGGRLFALAGGEGPPLLLLHGFPQTLVMWHRVAPALAKRFRVIAMDLRGYGWSSLPEEDPTHRATSKQVMAQEIREAMESLGHIHFAVAGHDRGGRVAYRMALDHPGTIERIAVLDIVPTEAMWASMDATRAMKAYHWAFLAQPAPIPETLIGAAALTWLDHTLASWTGTGTLDAFDPRALSFYRAAFNDPARLHALCEDYRSGATVDRADDAADLAAGRKILAPLLAIWGERGFPAAGPSPLAIWQDWAVKASGAALPGGHFLAEECPEATLAALMDFFSAS